MKVRLIGIVLISFLFAGCGEKSECVQNLLIMDEAARSFSLLDRMGTNTMIEPAALRTYFKGGVVPICRSSNKPYAAFSRASGPTCPNEISHTLAFRRAIKRPVQSPSLPR
jgi:hypothetical protein